MDEQSKQAKVPEGLKIEKGQKPARRGIAIPNFRFDPSLPQIIYPHYTNNKKTELSCVLIRPDGMAIKEKGIPKDDNHPLYRDIKAQYSEEEIQHNTAREVSIINNANDAIQAKQAEEAKEEKRRLLWQRKSAYLEMDVVKNTKFKSLKRKLRQATNPEEALAFGVAIIIAENPADEE